MVGVIVYMVVLLFDCRFDTESKDFFTQRTRIQVVHFILERQRFSDDDESTNNFGIERLMEECAYNSAYPLHDVSICQYQDVFVLAGILI